MKKIYEKPEIQIADVFVSSMMLENSITGTSGADGLGFGGNTSDSGITMGGAKERGSRSENSDIFEDLW